MKLYIFSSFGDRISREEKEVVEKKNSYETITKSGVGVKRFRKLDLDKPVLSSRSISMITLNGNPEAFVNIVIEEKKKQISDLEAKIAQEKNSIIKIKKEYVGIIENRILNGKYETVGMLNFEKNKTDDTISGKISLNAINPVVNIHDVVSFNEFINLISNNKIKKIHHIFVNGNYTNLSIIGYETTGADCVITIEKLTKLSTKTKIEIDVSYKEEN